MYFDKFPILQYLDRFGTKTKSKLVTDILRRVKINTVGKEESSFYIDYEVREIAPFRCIQAKKVIRRF